MTTPDLAAPSAVGPRLSVMMLLQFFLWGAWFVSTGPFMNAYGMSAGIKWAYTVGPIAAKISPLFLGMVADRFFASERVLGLLHILGGALLALAPMVFRATNDPLVVDALAAAALVKPDEAIAAALATVPAGSSGDALRTLLESGKLPTTEWLPFVLVLLAHMLCYMPTLGLTNTVAFHSMSEPAKQFPLVRVFGTIGWIIAGLLISLLAFDRSEGQYLLAGASGVVLGLYCFTLPNTPPPAKGRPFSARSALGLDALALLRRPGFAVFMMASFLTCIPLAAYYAFAGTFVDAQGINMPTAAIMSRGQMSEIFFMLIMPFCFARLGVKWMMAIGMLAWVVRYALFTYAAQLPPGDVEGALPWLSWIMGDPRLTMPIFIGILLHGICYDFFFVTGFIYVDRESPRELRASTQGFLVLVTQGLGMLIGAQASGFLFERAAAEDGGRNWQFFWLAPMFFALVVLIFFVVSFHDSSRRPDRAQA